MPSFEVIAYKREKEWTGKYGPMKDHIIDVRDEMGQTKEVSLSQKPTTPTPNVGDKLDLDLTPTDWGIKAKRVQQQQGGGGGTWKPRDPAETAAIQRQHAQKVAVSIASSAGWFNDFDPEDAAGQAKLALVSRLATWVQRDIAKGVAIATEDAQTKQNYGKRKDTELTGASDVPNDGAPAHPPASDAGTPWSDAA